jgi:hypothetical protein
MCLEPADKEEIRIQNATLVEHTLNAYKQTAEGCQGSLILAGAAQDTDIAESGNWRTILLTAH